MKSLRYFSSLLILMICMLSCGGDVKSNPEIEAKLVGSWSNHETENGIKFSQFVTYNDDNSYKTSLMIIFDYSPLQVVRITWNGTWRASKDKLWEQADVESVGLSYTSLNIFEANDFVEEVRKELKDPLISNIVSLETDRPSKKDKLVIEDEEGESTFIKD